MRQGALYERPHPAQMTMRIPPTDTRTVSVIRLFSKERRISLFPYLVRKTPCLCCRLHADPRKTAHDGLYLTPRLGLGTAREIPASELKDMKIASLDGNTGPYLADGFQKPFLAVADHDFGTRQSYEEGAPRRSCFPRRERPAGDAVFRERHEDNEPTAMYIRAVKDKNADGRRHRP